MLVGRMASAMRVITDSSVSGVLDLGAILPEGKTVREVLKDKHPQGMDARQEALIRREEEPQPTHPVLFDRLTGDSIKSAVRGGRTLRRGRCWVEEAMFIISCSVQIPL